MNRPTPPTLVKAAIGGLAGLAVVGVLVTAVPAVNLKPGQEVTVKCQNGRVANSHTGDTQSKVKCLATPSPSPTLTATPASSPSRTPTPTPTALPTTTPTPVVTPPAATATPTASPTPIPTPTPAPTPTPSPSTACTRTFSGDNSGATDITKALNTFIQGASNSVSCLNPGTYRVTGTVHGSGLVNATITGGGTIYESTRATDQLLLLDGGGSNLKVSNITIIGSNPTPGKWNVTYEHNHGIALGGNQGAEITGVTIKNVGGDGVYLSGGANQWLTHVRIHNNIFDGIGRMGIAYTDGVDDSIIEDNSFARNGYYWFDIEPNGATVAGRAAGATNFTIRNNTCTVKCYGDNPTDKTQATGYAFVTTNASGGGPCSNGTVTGNMITDPVGPYNTFRWNTFLPCAPLTVSGNTNQVKFAP